MGRALWITLQIKGRLVPLKGMGCRGRPFGDYTTCYGSVGAGSKAGKGSDQEEEAAWESWGEKGTERAGCTYTVYLSGHALCVISTVCPVFLLNASLRFFFLPRPSFFFSLPLFFFFLPLFLFFKFSCVEGTLFSAYGGLNASNWKYLSACILCGCVCPCIITSKNQVKVAGE